MRAAMVALGSSLLTPEVDAAIRHVAVNASLHAGGAIDADELFGAGRYAVLLAAADYRSTEGGSFVAWACQRAKWAMLDELRRHDPIPRQQRKAGFTGSGFVSIEGQAPEFGAVVAGTEDPNRGEVADEICRVLALVGELPPAWQQVVRCCYIDGLTTAATAQRLGCSSQNVSAILRKALARLRSLYGRKEKAPALSATREPIGAAIAANPGARRSNGHADTNRAFRWPQRQAGPRRAPPGGRVESLSAHVPPPRGVPFRRETTPDSKQISQDCPNQAPNTDE